jgi:hypothetical protein
MDRQGETYVPVKEIHQVSLRFNHVGPRWHHWGIFGRPVVFLDIADKHQTIVYFIEFRSDQETSCQENRSGFSIKLSRAFRVQKVPIYYLYSYVNGFCALLKSLAEGINPCDNIISLFHVRFRGFPWILGELETLVIIIQLVRKHVIQDEHWGFIWVKYLIFVFQCKILDGK